MNTSGNGAGRQGGDRHRSEFRDRARDCLLFAAEGARVVVAARRRELLDGLVAEIEAAGGVA